MAQLQDLLNKELVNKLYDIHTDDKYYNDLNKALELDAKKLDDLQSNGYDFNDYESIEGDYTKDENGI